MLEGGEDPRFIARRMVILASEDIGNADPRALQVAVAAAQAVEHVGLPEAALASRRRRSICRWRRSRTPSYEAIGRAREWVREHGAPVPPPTLRRAPPTRARRSSAAAWATTTRTTHPEGVAARS